MVRWARGHGEVAEVHRVTDVELVQTDLVSGPEVTQVLDGADEVAGALGAVDGEGLFAVVEVHRLEQGGQAQEVVPVEVGDEDVGYLHE